MQRGAIATQACRVAFDSRIPAFQVRPFLVPAREPALDCLVMASRRRLVRARSFEMPCDGVRVAQDDDATPAHTPG